VSAGLLWQAVTVLDILGLVPAPDNGSIQIFRASLTTREQRKLGRAERTIARGLKSFLEVGMALKEIRDKRLYRQHYDTFEEYCIMRWELSRPRAYELCAASEVVTELSAIADIRLLPENEAPDPPADAAERPRAMAASVEHSGQAGGSRGTPGDRKRHGGSRSAA
jgi:hypothetical protein